VKLDGGRPTVNVGGELVWQRFTRHDGGSVARTAAAR
jgi:hypothetical protein